MHDQVQQHFLSFLVYTFWATLTLDSFRLFDLISEVATLLRWQISLMRQPKASLMFQPVSALTAKNSQLYSAFSSSIFYLYFSSCSARAVGLSRSLLLPRSSLGMSLPQCRTSCCSQTLASASESSLVRSNTTHAAFDSVKQLYTMVRQRSCPAESQSSRLKVVLAWVTFLNRQSMPMVGFCGLYSPSTQRRRRVLFPTADLPMMMVLQFFRVESSISLIITEFITEPSTGSHFTTPLQPFLACPLGTNLDSK